MYESISILYVIDIIAKVVIVIIGFYVFKISWDAAKNKNIDSNIRENNLYSPYNCDEEAETLLILSFPIRIIRVVFSLGAIIFAVYFLYYPSYSRNLVVAIVSVYYSLAYSWRPVKVIITPEFITLTYSFLREQ